MLKFRKRLARGVAHTQGKTSSKPNRDTKSAAMKNAIDEAEAQDCVMSSPTDGGAVNEPLVVDFPIMHDGRTQERHVPPLTPPPSQKASQDQDNWPSDDERAIAPAPAPPDFTRRGIHIPSRTR